MNENRQINVRFHDTGTKGFHHPVVGDITLTYNRMALAWLRRMIAGFCALHGRRGSDLGLIRRAPGTLAGFAPTHQKLMSGRASIGRLLMWSGRRSGSGFLPIVTADRSAALENAGMPTLGKRSCFGQSCGCMLVSGG